MISSKQQQSLVCKHLRAARRGQGQVSSPTLSRTIAHHSTRPWGMERPGKMAHLCVDMHTQGYTLWRLRGQGAILKARSEAEHFYPEGFASPPDSQPPYTRERCQWITSSLPFIRETFTQLMAMKSQVLAIRAYSTEDPQMVIQYHPQTCLNSRIKSTLLTHTIFPAHLARCFHHLICRAFLPREGSHSPLSLSMEPPT